MSHIICIQSSIVGHLVCFQLLTITNKAPMNIVEHMPLQYGEVSFGYMSRSGIAVFLGRCISNFLRNLQIDFQSGCTSLQSYPWWRSVPFSPHPLQHLLLPEFFILTILIGVMWNLRVVLIYISLITKDFEHFFTCFSTIPDSSVLNSLFSSRPPFLIVCFLFFGFWFFVCLFVWLVGWLWFCSLCFV